MAERQEYIREIRGIFDRHGLIIKRNNSPILKISFESKKEMIAIQQILEQEGFKARICGKTLEFAGRRMIINWLKRIGTNQNRDEIYSFVMA